MENMNHYEENNMQNQLQPGQITRGMYLRLIIVLIAATIALPIILLVTPYNKGATARSLGKPQECTVINIRSVLEGRHSKYVTTFAAEDGTNIELDASCKDYVGRNTVLLVYNGHGSRQVFEFPKLNGLQIVMVVSVVLMWLTLFYYRITKKLIVIKNE